MEKSQGVGAAFWRAIATIVVWGIVLVGFVITAVFMVPEIGSEAMGAIFLLLAAGVVTSGFVWNWGVTEHKKPEKQKERSEAEDELYAVASNLRYGEKPKRGDRLADSLSRLSERELINLRDQLRRGEINEEELAAILNSQSY